MTEGCGWWVGVGRMEPCGGMQLYTVAAVSAHAPSWRFIRTFKVTALLSVVLRERGMVGSSAVPVVPGHVVPWPCLPSERGSAGNGRHPSPSLSLACQQQDKHKAQHCPTLDSPSRYVLLPGRRARQPALAASTQPRVNALPRALTPCQRSPPRVNVRPALTHLHLR